MAGPHKDFAAPVLQGPAVVAPLLNVRAVAARLAVGPTTVLKLCRLGRLRFVRIGNTVRIDPASVEAFIASGGSSPADS